MHSGTCATAMVAVQYFIADKEHDTESTNDYFGARYYVSNIAGRFLTPDDGSDQDPSDPQSWNLYSYVQNNPLANTDPDGHDCIGQTPAEYGTATLTVINMTNSQDCPNAFTYVNGRASSFTYNPTNGGTLSYNLISYDGQSASTNVISQASVGR
jgi:RHS repeat-associated protein